MIERTGLGRVRHIQVQELWVQEALKAKRFELHPILGTENPADMFTKHLDKHALERCHTRINLEIRSGRSAIAPHVCDNTPGEAAAEEECGSFATLMTEV